MYYLDESGFDQRDEHTRGWALSSERLSGFKTGKRSLERISVIAAYQESKLIAPMTYEGTLNTELFVTYLKKCLFPSLPKGSCVIMDNATPHKSAQVLKIAEKFGCIVLYLPPYSPDLNPIESTAGAGLNQNYINSWSNQINLLKTLFLNPLYITPESHHVFQLKSGLL